MMADFAVSNLRTQEQACPGTDRTKSSHQISQVMSYFLCFVLYRVCILRRWLRSDEKTIQYHRAGKTQSDGLNSFIRLGINQSIRTFKSL